MRGAPRPHRDLDDRGAHTGTATDLLAAVIAAVLGSLAWLARAARAIALAALDIGTAVRSAAARSCRRGRAVVAAVGGSSVTAWRRAVLVVGVAYLRARARRLTTTGALPAQDVAPHRRAFTGTFATTTFQNPWLPVGGRTVEAVVRVALVDAGLPAAEEVARAEVLLLDSSGSMGLPWSKLRALRWAAAAALEALPDGTWFAIVRGNEQAEVLYPPAGGLAIASVDTRQEAARALRLLCPEGGTAMGRWLLRARDLCSGYEGAIFHATLITDGRNESESPDELARVVKEVAGHLQCDCRGVGQAWEVAELQQIASALIGTVDIVAEPRELADGLRQVAQDATARCVDGVELRLWLARGVTVRAIREVHPTVEELVATATAPDADAPGVRSTYSTGAWRPGTRDYQVSLLVPAHVAGERMVAARCSVVVEGTAVAEAAISVGWTDDVSLGGGPDPVVAHYAAQRELVESIREGLASRAGGDEPTASAKLGRARDLAVATGHDATARLIDDVLEDDVDGTTRVRRTGDRAAEMTLASRSSRTLGFGRPTRRPPTES